MTKKECPALADAQLSEPINKMSQQFYVYLLIIQSTKLAANAL